MPPEKQESYLQSAPFICTLQAGQPGVPPLFGIVHYAIVYSTVARRAEAASKEPRVLVPYCAAAEGVRQAACTEIQSLLGIPSYRSSTGPLPATNRSQVPYYAGISQFRRGLITYVYRRPPKTERVGPHGNPVQSWV
jgi:hypothetical protein